MASRSTGDVLGLRAVAHPLRLSLLSLLTGQSMSAAEAARHLGESQANVSYHLRRLADSGFIQIVEETKINGGLARRYRHIPESGEALRAGGITGHISLMTTMAEALKTRARSYLPESDQAFTDAEVRVSAESWERIQELARELGTLIHDAALPSDDPRGLPIAATIATFRLADEQQIASP